MKRIIDLIVSILVLILVIPLLIPISIILLLTGEHYIFYSHDRVGLRMKNFKLIKFSTMLKDSPNLGTKDITMKNDPRVFPFGRWLRKTKINELPQLINVIKGDLSIIGPRPLTPKNFCLYSEEVQRNISLLKPGLSGIGSIIFRDEEVLLQDNKRDIEDYYKTNISRYKGELELWYFQNRNTLLDFKLMALTMIIIIFPSLNITTYFTNLPKWPSTIDI